MMTTHTGSEGSVFLKACRREPVPYTPIWLMRQAGRYMKEYRELRDKVPFLKLCKSPQLVSEVTVFAAERLRVDAAILFSDLLLPVEAMGRKLQYGKNAGPSISPPVREASDVDDLKEVEIDSLAYIFEGVRRTRADLSEEMPLIGFAGAPFTLASYLIEGGASRNYVDTKSLMYRDEGAWNALMEKIVRCQIELLNRQLLAGCQAVQLFDSWVGCLSPQDYRRYVKPHTKALLDGIREGAPVIHFATGANGFLRDLREAGGNVIGVDWRVDLDRAWEMVGDDVGIMGNLDPVALFGDGSKLRAEAERILGQAGARPGHVFNLGHGVLPGTPVDNVVRLVELVHELSQR